MAFQETRWHSTVTRPDIATWPALLNEGGFGISSEPMASRRQSARKRLVDAAQQYVMRLGQAAKAAGVSLPETGLLTGDADTQRILMTGHQPVPFHGGLSFKYLCAEQTAVLSNSIGLAVMIDTDEGDPANFQYPESAPEQDSSQCRIASSTFCEAPTIFALTRFLPSDQLKDVTDSVAEQLKQSTSDASADRFRSVAEIYQSLAEQDVPPTEASVIARWTNGIGSRLLELPLSAICAFSEVIDLITEILMKTNDFAATYNQELDQFRSKHEIRNAANPFPDLQSTDDGQELPFWVLNSKQQTRHRLSVRTSGNEIKLFAAGDVILDTSPNDLRSALDGLTLNGIQLIPRGALVTAFLRLLFADLFVHGLGGEHYDPFTNRLIRSWWNVEAPPFTVASASDFLFAEQRDELHRLQEMESQLRDLRYNPQRHFESGVFSNDLETRLRQLVEKKQDAIASMKTAHADGRSAKDIGHQIQQISDEIKSAVDEGFHEDLAALDRITDSTRQAYECRTYPWFLFP